MTEPRLSIFQRYAISTNSKKINPLPLKDHPQIASIIDTLSRQHHHHLLLLQNSSERMHHALIESVVERLSTDLLPKSLTNTACIYFNVAHFLMTNEKPATIAQDFQILRENNQRLIFIINQIDPLLENSLPTLNTLGKCLQSILSDENWRLIILTKEENIPEPFYFNSFFTRLKLLEPTTAEALSILKCFRTELENYHHVIISEETLTSTLSMANHYLSGPSTLDKAIELLDSAAARASAEEQAAHKPIVTSAHLAQVVSHLTHIPLTHLLTNKFQTHKFADALQAHLFGQDTAIQTISFLLQSACIKLHKKPGVLCSFLFAGPPGTGKTTLALLMTDYLFGNTAALLRLNFSKIPHSLADLTVTTGGTEVRSMGLLSAIQQTPYAVLLIEHIEKLPAEVMALFKNIIAHGFAFDAKENKYDFRHVIIIMTTTVGTERMTHLTQHASEKNKTLDLMQLVLNEHVHEFSGDAPQQLSLHEIRDEMISTLTEHFSRDLLHRINIIPFMPLDYAAYEKMMATHLKVLTKRLSTSFNIELSYPSEIIKFLAHEALWQKQSHKSLDKMLEQQLYSCVSHEILTKMDDKNKSRRLVLQLNDNGQLLRCDYVVHN